MNKRFLLRALAALPFIGMGAAAHATQKNSATWKVPPGVDKIRVRSWNADGTPDMDRTLRVEPNQIFRIDAIE